MNGQQNTIIGKVYCTCGNEDPKGFIMIRVIDIYENDDKKFVKLADDKKFVKLAEIDQNNGFRINDDKIIDMEYKEFEKSVMEKKLVYIWFFTYLC